MRALNRACTNLCCCTLHVRAQIWSYLAAKGSGRTWLLLNARRLCALERLRAML